jgi:hypothetical protein
MAKKAQVEKATKAMFEVLKRGKVHNLSIQCQLDLFDKIIKPILLYISISLNVNVRLFGSLPLEKTKILVFSTLILSCQNLQYSEKTSICF